MQQGTASGPFAQQLLIQGLHVQTCSGAAKNQLIKPWRQFNHQGQRGSGLFVTSPDNPPQTCDTSCWRPLCFTVSFAITLEWKTNSEFEFEDVFPGNEFLCFLLSLRSWLEISCCGLPTTSSPLRHSGHSFSVSKSLMDFVLSPGFGADQEGLEGRSTCVKPTGGNRCTEAGGAALWWVQDREGAVSEGRVWL